jgi:hypothetical protein
MDKNKLLWIQAILFGVIFTTLAHVELFKDRIWLQLIQLFVCRTTKRTSDLGCPSLFRSFILFQSEASSRRAPQAPCARYIGRT